MNYTNDSPLENNLETSNASPFNHCLDNAEIRHDGYIGNTVPHVNANDTARERQLTASESTSSSTSASPLIQCNICGKRDKPKLRQCGTCKYYQCTSCIKVENGCNSTKKRRNPQIHICIRCIEELQSSKRANRKYNKGHLERSRDNSLSPIRKESSIGSESDIINREKTMQVSLPKNILKVEGDRGKCVFCHLMKKNVHCFKSYCDLYKYMAQLLNEVKKNDMNDRGTEGGKVFNWNIFYLLIQTVNSPYYDIPLDNNIISCEDCFRFCIEQMMNCNTNCTVNSNESKFEHEVGEKEHKESGNRAEYLISAYEDFNDDFDYYRRLVYFAYQSFSNNSNAMTSQLHNGLPWNMMYNSSLRNEGQEGVNHQINHVSSNSQLNVNKPLSLMK